MTTVDMVLRIVDDRGRWLSLPRTTSEARSICRLYPVPPDRLDAVAEALLAFYGIEEEPDDDVDELETPG